ncbi:regucalcin-like [Panonychus citri]|uniref:regucalcin-like n=1 Tax=Panonychus citri TaxID=50023 RepID=UPI0023072ABB|nr:regucalcin-like [Panonychus citri]
MFLMKVNFISIVIFFLCFQYFQCKSIQMNDQSDYNVSIVSNRINDLGEGPFYEPTSDSLYYVDAFKGTIVHSPLNGTPEDVHVLGNKLVSLVIPFSEDESSFIVTVRSSVAKYNWKTRNVQTLSSLGVHPAGDERFNDGACDSAGRLFIGSVVESTDAASPLVKGGGSIYRLDGNRLIKVASGFTLSNGMDWSVNGTSFYFNDSEDQKIYIFDYNSESGTLTNKRIFVDLKNHTDFVSNEYPDGLMVDANDYIWTALYGGGRLVKINPKTSRVESSIRVPASKVTSLTFGGPNLDKIYVTSSQSQSEPDSGKIYLIKSKTNQLLGKGFAYKFVSS